MSTPSPEFIDSVRAALTHLYDAAYLQTHPLTFHTSSDHPLDQVTRAQQLRRTLLACIEALRPQSALSPVLYWSNYSARPFLTADYADFTDWVRAV